MGRKSNYFHMQQLPIMFFVQDVSDNSLLDLLHPHLHWRMLRKTIENVTVDCAFILTATLWGCIKGQHFELPLTIRLATFPPLTLEAPARRRRGFWA